MKDTAKLVFLIVLVALVLAIAAPGVIFVWRLMESWTGENTGQLLGGALACLGGVGAIFAAIAGAVISTLGSLLNSASAIFTMDVYKRILAPDASERSTVRVARGSTLVAIVIGDFRAEYLVVQ